MISYSRERDMDSASLLRPVYSTPRVQNKKLNPTYTATWGFAAANRQRFRQLYLSTALLNCRILRQPSEGRHCWLLCLLQQRPTLWTQRVPSLIILSSPINSRMGFFLSCIGAECSSFPQGLEKPPQSWADWLINYIFHRKRNSFVTAQVTAEQPIKGIVHRKMKIHPLAAHHYTGGGLGDVFESTKHFRSVRGKQHFSQGNLFFRRHKTAVKTQHASILLMWCHTSVHKPRRSYSHLKVWAVWRWSGFFCWFITSEEEVTLDTGSHSRSVLWTQTLHPPLHRHSGEWTVSEFSFFGELSL